MKQKKTCAVCKTEVPPNTGTYCYGVLVHKACKDTLKRYPWRFKKRRKAVVDPGEVIVVLLLILLVLYLRSIGILNF